MPICSRQIDASPESCCDTNDFLPAFPAFFLSIRIEMTINNYGEEKLNTDDKEDTIVYKVVMNHEEQYSIWPAEMENPLGWKDAGRSGLKDECLSYIKEVW